MDSEKYQIRAWDLKDPISIAPLIMQLNQIRKANVALQANSGLQFHDAENDQILCYSKTAADKANSILVAVNLDAKNEQACFVELDLVALGLQEGTPFEVEDLLTGARYEWNGTRNYVALKPALPAHIFRINRT